MNILVTGLFHCVFFCLEARERRRGMNQQETNGATATLQETPTESKGTIRNKSYDLAEARLFTERNGDIDYKILLALYEHRALTPSQLQKGWFPHLHVNSVRNRTKALADRRILSVNEKNGICTRPVKFYSLSTFGLRIVTENILEVMEYTPQYDEKKEHYTIDDLKIRSQHYHHYELQEWVVDFLSKTADLFHCEWRRFPFVEEASESIRVKPDWLFFDADKETIQNRAQNSTVNPLLYPYLYRKEIFTNESLTPTLCVECDRGTMNRMELVEKWEGYRSLPKQYKPKAISIFYTAKHNGDIRHRLLRESMAYVFEPDVLNGDIQLFEGSPSQTIDISTKYFYREKKLLSGEDMVNEQTLYSLVESYNQSSKDFEVKLLDTERTVERLKLPVTPDAIITKQTQDQVAVQFVFYGLSGWVNPFVKINALKRWLKEGHLSLFSEIRFVLLYPDDSFLSDVRSTDRDIYYVPFNEVEATSSWGKVYYEERKYKMVKWQEVVW